MSAFVMRVNSRTAWVIAYGCVECQREHVDCLDPLYKDHIMRQSKHGWYSRPALPWEQFALELLRTIGPLPSV